MGTKRPKIASPEEIAFAVASLRKLADLQAVALEEMDALLTAAWSAQQRLLAISVASAPYSVITGKGTRLAPFPEWKPDRETSRRLGLGATWLRDLKAAASGIQAGLTNTQNITPEERS